MKDRFLPRLIAWEVTGRCNLKCVHCRASATDKPDPNELTTEEIEATLDDIVGFSNPILILTGGEPLVREDVFEIAKYATGKGLRVVLGTNATLITPEIAVKLMESGIKRISVSLDCAYAEEHDEFRGVAGAYDLALKGIEACKEVGLEFQINTTITKRNIGDIQKIFDLAVELGAVAHHIFLLVPTGRGKAIEDEEIPPEDYEMVLNWMYDRQKEMDTRIAEGHMRGHGSKMFMKATCAPHFFRVMHQRSKEDGSNITIGRAGLDTMTKGCLGGTAFAFISRIGEVFPCGYLPVEAGDIREQSFKEIWENSRLFIDLRDPKKLRGRCGACEYKTMCGGCRARAYARYGDYLAEEPYCIYKPKAWRGSSRG